ncbi:hypothetical protein FOZ76_22100 [Verticiella sediminum]|uniref:Uncharacterized protein n=1 Tax=Verticiella sediminum TaxID=1247510 RepID=A0A556AC83_9BURK|nr:hypothetical protein [Verticiella sediminum]TSH90506.1 hypothetical protein FOZ76_22100 [Verticiella sediminum]
MQPDIVIGAAHWLYLAGVAVIVLTMILRANVVVPSIIGTFLVVYALTGSSVSGVAGIFQASIVAARELFNIFLVIAFMTALLNSLKALRSDVRMVEPFRVVMTNGHTAFFILAAVTYLISLFFWPTPAVPLVSAILLPAAIAAGLPALAGAMAIAIAGQGMALSSDYVIGVAPMISAKAAGVSTAIVADRALVLSLVVGAVALLLGYLSMRKRIRAPSQALLEQWQAKAEVSGAAMHEHGGSFEKEALTEGSRHDEPLDTPAHIRASLHAIEQRRIKWSKLFAVLTPIAFIAVVAVMVLPRLGWNIATLRGGEAAALVGGVAALIMIFATLAMEGPRRMLDVCADHITDGFVFAFKAMGSVLPIAGFFFLGNGETTAAILGTETAPSLLFELIQAYQTAIPSNAVLVSFGVLIVGMITGIDGSGFSGLPLTGTLSGALAPVAGVDPETLAAIGQMGAVWTGGGTLIAWSSLIAVAGFARVPVLDAVRALMLPVLAGLASCVLVSLIVW